MSWHCGNVTLSPSAHWGAACWSESIGVAHVSGRWPAAVTESWGQVKLKATTATGWERSSIKLIWQMLLGQKLNHLKSNTEERTVTRFCINLQIYNTSTAPVLFSENWLSVKVLCLQVSKGLTWRKNAKSTGVIGFIEVSEFVTWTSRIQLPSNFITSITIIFPHTGFLFCARRVCLTGASGCHQTETSSVLSKFVFSDNQDSWFSHSGQKYFSFLQIEKSRRLQFLLKLTEAIQSWILFRQQF